MLSLKRFRADCIANKGLGVVDLVTLRLQGTHYPEKVQLFAVDIQLLPVSNEKIIMQLLVVYNQLWRMT